MRLTIDSENLIKKDISQVILNKDIHLTLCKWKVSILISDKLR